MSRLCSGARGGLFELGAPDVVARLVGADELSPVAFGDLLGEECPAAFRARLEHWLVPEREIALRIVHAAVKHLATTRFALGDLAAVLGTDHAGQLLLDVLALRVAGARRELTKPALLDHEVLATVGARLLEDLVRLGGRHAL